MDVKANTKSWRQSLGEAGELMAADYLESRGYRLLKKRFRAGRQGEIDLIVSKGPSLIFVEVKTRLEAENEYSGQLAVDGEKQRKIASTALFYLKNEQFCCQPRFDVILVSFSAGRGTISQLLEAGDRPALQKLARFIHIEQAFASL